MQVFKNQKIDRAIVAISFGLFAAFVPGCVTSLVAAIFAPEWQTWWLVPAIIAALAALFVWRLSDTVELTCSHCGVPVIIPARDLADENATDTLCDACCGAHWLDKPEARELLRSITQEDMQ